MYIQATLNGLRRGEEVGRERERDRETERQRERERERENLRSHEFEECRKS